MPPPLAAIPALKYLAMFEAALSLAEGLGRTIDALKKDGELTQEQVDDVVARAAVSDNTFDDLLASLGVADTPA